MKKLYVLIAVFIAVCGSLWAQTDVTATYLTNAGFDISCNYLATTASSNLPSGATSNQVVNGWTLTASAANTASSAFEYGYPGTINLSGTTYGFIPTMGYDNATGAGHGSLGISAAWASTITYYQNVTLPAGKYSLEYAAYNSGPAAAAYSKVGWVPTSGTSVLSTKTTFTQAAWSTETVTFTVPTSTTGKIQVGVGSPNSGSATVGRIFFDYVKLSLLPVDKATLLHLKDSANVMYNNKQTVGATSTVYADLNTAIGVAQVVYDNVGATAEQVLGQEVALKTAITNVYSAITLQTRISTWTTLPYDATSIISNPSFESDIAIGWTNPGGLSRQSNSSFAKKVGTNYAEKWMSSPGTLTGLRLYQTINNIPNGIYLIKASAQAIQQTTTPTYPGMAYITANNDSTEVFATNDYSVQTKVTNNTLTLGFATKVTGNWVAVDNFTLSYISDGSPYVVLTPSSLFFDANNLTKIINVSGGNLTSNLTLTAPTGITLSKTTLTPTEVATGTPVTATFDNVTAISAGTISATSGTMTQTVTINTSADAGCFTTLYPSLTNLIPGGAYMNDISAFGGWGHKSVVMTGAYCGAACVKFDATTNTYPDGAALDVPTVTWAANATYRLHVWVKAVDGTFAFFAKGTNPDVTISVPQNDQWVLIDQTFTTGAAPTANFFSFNNVDGASTGKVAYLDNYELYNITSLVTSVNKVATNGFTTYVADKKIVTKFDLESAANVTIAVYNVSGMLLESKNAACGAGTNVKTLDSVLPSGVYVVKLSANGKINTQRIIK